jgi:hypothetical protein
MPRVVYGGFIDGDGRGGESDAGNVPVSPPSRPLPIVEWLWSCSRVARVPSLAMVRTWTSSRVLSRDYGSAALSKTRRRKISPPSPLHAPQSPGSGHTWSWYSSWHGHGWTTWRGSARKSRRPAALPARRPPRDAFLGTDPAPAAEWNQFREVGSGLHEFTPSTYRHPNLSVQIGPKQLDSTASRLLSEVKQVRAQLVLGWVTTVESWVSYLFFAQIGNDLGNPFCSSRSPPRP